MTHLSPTTESEIFQPTMFPVKQRVGLKKSFSTSRNSLATKFFFPGLLNYTPDYGLHRSEFDQELFHKSLVLLSHALTERGTVQLYHLTTVAHCSSIAQTLEDFMVSLKAITGETLVGGFSLILQPPGKSDFYTEILLLRDTPLHEEERYTDQILELWDNLIYSDSTLYATALRRISVADKTGVSRAIEKIRQMSKSCDCSSGTFTSRKQYRIFDYTEKRAITPVFTYQTAEDSAFNKERFLKMIASLKKK